MDNVTVGEAPGSEPKPLSERISEKLSAVGIKGTLGQVPPAQAPIVKLPKGTPMNSPVETLDPNYKGWSQQYRQTQDFMEQYRLKQDDEKAKQIQETGVFPTDAVSAVTNALSLPQSMILGAGVGQTTATVEEFINKSIPGGTDAAIKALKDKGWGDNAIAAMFTLPAVALTLGTDPLNAVQPGGGAAKAGVKAAASAGKAGKSSRIAGEGLPSSMSPEGKGFEEQKFGTTVRVRVEHSADNIHEDAVKGLNAGHALSQAQKNWPDANRIQIIGVNDNKGMWNTNRTTGGSSLSTDEAASTKIVQVPVDQLKIKDSAHPDPVSPEKIKAIQQKLQDTPSKVPAIEVKLTKDGEYEVVDGRHRLAAATAEGFDSVPAVISVSKGAAEDPALLQTAHDMTNDPVFARLLDEKGRAQLPLMLAVTRAAVGGTVGALTGDEEDRLRNMLVGAGLGAAASPAVVRRLISTFQANPKMAQPGFLSTPEGQRMAQVAKLEKAMPQSEMSALYQKEVNAFTESRTIPQIKEEADLLNKYGKVSEDTILDMQPGTILNDAEKTALVNVVSASGNRLKQLAENVKPEFPESYDELIRQLYRHSQLDARRLGTASEEGRVLRMEQELAGEKKFLDQLTSVASRLKFGQSKERLAEVIQGMKSQDELVNFAKNIARPGFGDMMVELWINGLLSGPKTHVVNTLGNAGFLGMNVAERGLARVMGSENIASGEASAMLRAGLSNWQDSMRTAYKAFKDDAGSVGGKIEDHQRAITVDNIDHLGFMQKMGVKIDETGTAGRAIDGTASWFFRAPGRMLKGSDEFFKSMAYNMELHAQAVREATAEIEAQGLTGAQAKQVYQDTFNRIVKDPSSDIASKAKQFAAYTTFTNELGPTGKALQELSNASPMGKIALPFVVAPTNLFKAGLVERTPLGLLSKRVRDTISKGGADADLAMTRLAMGSMTVAAMATWASQGFFTGQGPKDATERAKWIQNGWQPHAINISKIMRGGDEDAKPRPGDKFRRFDALEPLGMILGMSADISESWGQLSQQDRDAASLAVVLGTAFSKNFASKTFVKGVAGLTNAISNPDNNFERWMIHEAGTLVPMSGLTGTISREIDPTIRDAQSVVDGMRTRVWPLSTDVFPDRDLFGNAKSYAPGWGPDSVSPFYSSEFKGHPVLNALEEDKAKIGDMPRSVNGVDLKTHPELYDRLQVLVGHEVKDALGRNYEEAMQDVVDQAKSLDLTTGPDSWRAERFREVTRQFRALGVQQLLDENPDLADAVGAAKASKNEKKTGIRIN